MHSKTSKELSLIRACKRCDFKAVQEILNIKNGKLLLQSSSSSGLIPSDFQKIQNTVVGNSNVDLNFRESKFQMTPLMIASLRGSRDIALLLIKCGANLTLRDVKGNTSLQLACMKQRFHVIDALLQNKANPNDVNISGWNCLISAVNYFHEDSAIMLLLLLQTGAKTEHKDNMGLTCIDHAVRKNKINAIRVILNFNPKLASNCTRALINAAIKGYFDIVLLLLNFGVNPNKIDIITGTGPLHEAVRYNEIKDEKSRLERLKIVHYLCLFGADPETLNTKRETPNKLASIKPESIAAQYVEAMNSFYSISPKKPKFINISATSLKDLFQVPNYPLLKPQPNWTRNDHRFCSSFNSKVDLVTNLIDGDPNSMWTAVGQLLNWVIFDFKADHCISKIRIYGWKSKEMPSECYLQVSNSLEGPWNNVQTFHCEMIGSSLRNSPGMPMDFDGFHAVARYWRLVIAKNYGSYQTSFHSVEFFGYDYRISKLIEQLKLTEYEDLLIENDLNQIDALVSCTYDKFEKIPIERKTDKDKLWNFILEFQRKVKPLKKLEWFNEPPPFALVGQNLAAFSVTSTAFLTDSLQLISHGGGLMNGETCIDMEPGGMNDPSMAIFRNISFSNLSLFNKITKAGKYILEIKSLNDSEVSITSQSIQIFEVGDPEYEKLIAKDPDSSHSQSFLKNDALNNTINNSFTDHDQNFSAQPKSSLTLKNLKKNHYQSIKQMKLKNNQPQKQPINNQNNHVLGESNGEEDEEDDVDEEDDTLEQIYSFADFSTEPNSKMKITKWLSKSQDKTNEDDDNIDNNIEDLDNLSISNRNKSEINNKRNSNNNSTDFYINASTSNFSSSKTLLKPKNYFKSNSNPNFNNHFLKHNPIRTEVYEENEQQMDVQNIKQFGIPPQEVERLDKQTSTVTSVGTNTATTVGTNTNHNRSSPFGSYNKASNPVNEPINLETTNATVPSKKMAQPSKEPLKISQSQQTQYLMPEYEIQTLTLEINEDTVSLYSSQNNEYTIKTQSFKKSAINEPKNEARVYVNNPELLEHQKEHQKTKGQTKSTSTNTTESSSISKRGQHVYSFASESPLLDTNQIKKINVHQSSSPLLANSHLNHLNQGSFVESKKNPNNSITNGYPNNQNGINRSNNGHEATKVKVSPDTTRHSINNNHSITNTSNSHRSFTNAYKRQSSSSIKEKLEKILEPQISSTLPLLPTSAHIPSPLTPAPPSPKPAKTKSQLSNNNSSVKSTNNPQQPFYSMQHNSSLIHKSNKQDTNKPSPSSLKKESSINKDDQNNINTTSKFENSLESVSPPAASFIPPPPPLPNFFKKQTEIISTAPPLPPPPPPPISQFPLNGLLKFKRTRKSSNGNQEIGLQEELKKRLSSVRKKLQPDELEEPANNQYQSKRNSIETTNQQLISNNQNHIFTFNPENKNLGNSNELKSNPSSNNNSIRSHHSQFEINPNETFTSKAKKALENYKSSRSNSVTSYTSQKSAAIVLSNSGHTSSDESKNNSIINSQMTDRLDNEELKINQDNNPRKTKFSSKTRQGLPFEKQMDNTNGSTNEDHKLIQ